MDINIKTAVYGIENLKKLAQWAAKIEEECCGSGGRCTLQVDFTPGAERHPHKVSQPQK